MTALFGAALACIALAVLSLVEWDEPESIYRLTGSALYLAGTILVTIAFNLARNDILAAAAPDGHDSADLWRRYVREWTAWNHVRTAAALAAATLFTVAP